jgi:CBS domain-containing protein
MAPETTAPGDEDGPGALLAGHPPFDSVPSATLAELLAGAVRHRLSTGGKALVEDGTPATGLWTVMTGSVELIHEGEVIQVLEPGESFGHPSLLTGMAPAFTVRAREPTECLVLARGPALSVLGTAAGAAYVATTMRWRLVRSGHTVHGLLDVGTTPVSAIMRPPAWCERSERVAALATRLGSDGISALLVDLGGSEIGIITDAQIRAGLVADPGVGALAAAEIAQRPVPTVPVDQLAIEATVDLLAASAEHAAVLDGERIIGLISAADLLGLDAHSPIALRHTVLGAADDATLQRAASHLPGLFVLLHRAGVPPRDLGRVLSLQHDAVVSRLIDFSLWRHGPAPLPWAWLDLGSAARREFTLASDQDNALAYGEPEPGSHDAIDAYFARLGQEVNDGLSRCGIGVDNNGVLAGDRRWRMSKSAWLQTFDECLTQPDESHLIRAQVAFDFRDAGGGLMISSELSARVRAAHTHPDLMRLIARSALGFPVGLGFRGRLVTEPDGRFDIKRCAILPLVNLVRFHALAAGVTISATTDRIDAVASVGTLPADEAAALSEAFEVITRLRFAHHAAATEAGQPADNLLEPGALTPVARTDLREALHTVRRAQKALGAWAPAGR